ncbi:MAG: fasciclin domain-containing protein [Armatimonadetes bacterium]|nr:fasciclin domain-containing protein [Armatimonadota bacterium]GIV12387.1 MAG: beta-Ig-H3/fasciclin [Fimbriimonadales bacterium]CUU35305.1 Uncaracterized surface protein containing fasciclin (FAS1) repeats [Armatimonadetes bacterium DC]
MKNGKWFPGAFAAIVLTVGVVAAPREKKDIVDTAVAAGQFKTLVKLVQEAGLVDALRGEGPFTVFAPTDEAFAKLPKAQVDALLKDKEALKQVLLYHVVSGKVMSKDVVKLKSAKTLQGKSINIRVRNNTVYINDAKVVKADIECTNGVIHVIDKVILPPKDTPRKGY